mmetsp:Transcript_52587/g.52957  ORF Transcript_52587/g.52957 Transcript_52587/m.52957 type:complete len:113 (-) Transcript_52587:429-767(-)
MRKEGGRGVNPGGHARVVWSQRVRSASNKWETKALWERDRSSRLPIGLSSYRYRAVTWCPRFTGRVRPPSPNRKTTAGCVRAAVFVRRGGMGVLRRISFLDRAREGDGTSHL